MRAGGSPQRLQFFGTGLSSGSAPGRGMTALAVAGAPFTPFLVGAPRGAVVFEYCFPERIHGSAVALVLAEQLFFEPVVYLRDCGV